jgi:hypothetical protein
LILAADRPAYLAFLDAFPGVEIQGLQSGLQFAWIVAYFIGWELPTWRAKAHGFVLNHNQAISR